jgi:hypothetical protein
MPAATAGLFLIDFVFRPFAKICEKMPIVSLLMCLVLYAFIAYVVIKSAYMSDQHN